METSDCTSSWGKYFFGIYFIPRIGIAVWNELTNCRWRWRKKMQVRTRSWTYFHSIHVPNFFHSFARSIHLFAESKNPNPIQNGFQIFAKSRKNQYTKNFKMNFGKNFKMWKMELEILQKRIWKKSMADQFCLWFLILLQQANKKVLSSYLPT